MMAAKLEKTKTPGVFKRGGRYAVIYRDGEGCQHQESARTYDETRRLRSTREASVSEGSYQSGTRERFADYAEAWIDRYRGTGRRGFAEHEARLPAQSQGVCVSPVSGAYGSSRSRRGTSPSSWHGCAMRKSRVATWQTRRSSASSRPSGHACARLCVRGSSGTTRPGRGAAGA